MPDLTPNREHQALIDRLPAALRAVLANELAAGNAITETHGGFPAPPIGACVCLEKRITTRRPDATDGLRHRARNSSLSAGELSDSQGHYFLVEPPVPEPPPPDMNAIRGAAGAPDVPGPIPLSAESNAVRRFRGSMGMDFEKWHDGTGYDLEIIRAANAAERSEIEAILIRHGLTDWRDVEALAEFDSPGARAALRRARKAGEHGVRLAVDQFRPDLAPETDRAAALIQVLREAPFYGGLSQALDEAAGFHPTEVIQAVLQGALERVGEAAVHFAALALFLHGRTTEPFEMAERPFLLRFHTTSRPEREGVFRELCERIGVDPTPFLEASGIAQTRASGSH